MYYLYIKQHNDTGLKYLGQTKQKNPFTYKGSGTYWKRHIKTHGYNVTTTILLKTECLHCLKQTGLYFSTLFGIVSSKEWANLIPEQGDDILSINQTGKNLYGYNGYAPNSLKALKEGRDKQQYLRKNSPEWVATTSKNISEGVKNYIAENGSWWSGKNHKPESIEKQKATYAISEHQKGTKNSQYGTMWISSLTENKSKKHSKNEPIPIGWIKGRKFNYS